MKAPDAKEYVLVDGVLKETTPDTNPTNEQNTNTSLNEEPVIQEQKIEKQNLSLPQTEPVLKIKDFNLHYNLTRNPFLHKNSDHDGINSIEEYYLLKGKKYYNFGALIRTKLLGPFTTKRLIKKAFKSWREDANYTINQLIILGDAQTVSDDDEKEKKINFFINLFPYISFIVLLVVLACSIKFFNKPEGLFKLISYITLALSIFLISINSLFNKSIAKYNLFIKKGKNEYLKLKSDFVIECNKKFDETEKYYCKKINRKFNNNPLNINDVSYDESSLNALQDTIANNSQVLENKEKILKLNKFKRGLLSFLSVINVIASVAVLIYSVITHFIKK